MSPDNYKSDNPGFSPALLHPRHWLMWVGMGAWWFLIQLPYPVLLQLGRLVGRVLAALERDRREITAHNLRLCFPDLPEKDHHRLLMEVFESAGIALFETAISWWWSNRRLRRICQVHGIEHLVSNGKPTLILGMHFTPLDIGIAGLSLHHDYGVMYRPHRNPVFNYLQYRGRSRIGHAPPFTSHPFPRKDTRTLMRLLKSGIPVWYAPDQDYGMDHSLFAPFFGVPAATITATSRIARITGAQVVPHTVRRLPHAKGYVITLHPPVENFPSGDELADAVRINTVLEHHIRDNPGQYLWAHRRFKTRTADMPERYPELAARQEAKRRTRWEEEKRKRQQARRKARQQKH